MAVILTLLPSGTLIEAMQESVVADLGLSIAASGEATITQSLEDTLFEKSVRRINRKLSLEIEIVSGDLDPRPSEAVIDLIILQNECILQHNRNEKVKNSNAAVKMVKLEGIAVEFIDISKSRSADINAKYGFCSELNLALRQYHSSGPGSIDGADKIWSGSRRRWETATHDDTTSDHPHYDNMADGGTNLPYDGIGDGSNHGRCE